MIQSLARTFQESMQNGNHAGGRHCRKIALMLKDIKFEVTNETISRLSHYKGVGQKSLNLIEKALKNIDEEEDTVESSNHNTQKRKLEDPTESLAEEGKEKIVT